MNEVIRRAIKSINEILQPSSPNGLSNFEKSELINVCTLLNRLLELDLTTNDWARLFCRQLNRLMDYNQSFTQKFWAELRDNILYVIEKQNDKQNMSINCHRFIKRMELEAKLEQRELEFQRTFGEQKSFDQLFRENRTFLEEYLDKCISLHSMVDVRGVMDNVEDLCRCLGITNDVFSSESRGRIEKKIKCFEIPLDCSCRSVQNVDVQLFNNFNSYRAVNNTFNNFLPSTELRFDLNYQATVFEKTMQSERWIVLLGDPGSAKTSLLRWITRIFAEAAHRNDQEVLFTRDGHDVLQIPVRIPILIRIGEFAEWYEQHRTKILMDYIGTHTWFSQPYVHNDDRNVLKDFVYHGHVLFLLDGLDEISEVERRGEIVNLVRQLIDEYVRAPDFLSALDGTIFGRRTRYCTGVETQSPRTYGANQIVVTSRIVGYQLNPLVGPHISHYLLLLMNNNAAKNFASKWIVQVEKGITNILSTENIKLDEEKMKVLSNKRSATVKLVFEKSSEFMILNPGLLSLICTLIFRLSEELYPKSRIEVYYYAVQAVLRSWTNSESSITKDLLIDFLINLSTYLHLESPSGLIDTFDIKQLCCVILQKQGIANDRIKLREHANKLTLALGSNIGIVVERGLQVFGFQHLSFQEYFVSQHFVKMSSLEEVSKRILTFIVNPRFRESLLLALAWISWKWSFEHYDKLCSLLVTPTEDYAIPIGALLFLEALDDILTLPSKSVIFIALKSIFDHSSSIVLNTCFILNLFKLPEDIIIEWLHLYLRDNKQLLRFCYCLQKQFHAFDTVDYMVAKSISPMVCQQLWTFHNISTSAEFLIDQTLRRIMMPKNAPDELFNKELSAYFLSNKNYECNVHPVILSVIIAVCGGVSFKEEQRIKMLAFSPKRMHRESSIIPAIATYLVNNKEPHSIKVQTLIKQYESVLENASQADTSLDIVDTFIALICLQGFSQPLIYQKYHGYQALSLALNRMKRIWLYWRESNNMVREYITCDNTVRFSIISECELIIKVFLSQFPYFNKECLEFSLVCADALRKLDIEWSSKLLMSHIFLPENVHQCLKEQQQQRSSHFNDGQYQNQLFHDIHRIQMFQDELCFLLNFVPPYLQKLYYCLIVNPSDNADSLPLVVLLLQCLSFLEDVNKLDRSFYLVLSMLQVQLKQHMLENYASALFWSGNAIFKREELQQYFEGVENHVFIDQLLIAHPQDWNMLINVERQRISDIKNMPQNQMKDVGLFAATISLARLFQARYQFRDKHSIKHIGLSVTEIEDMYTAVSNIFDPILRIIALSIILEMKNPFIFDEELREKLEAEMIDLLESLLPDLSLLTATLLFIRCYTQRQFFFVQFQRMAKILGKELKKTSTGKLNEDKEVAFIALRDLNDFDLSPHLSEFARETENLADLLQFNSSIFFKYFTNTTLFQESNTILLSSLYLTELAFDAQILQMYTDDVPQRKNSMWKELQNIWKDPFEKEKIMTYNAAKCITNYLEMSNTDQLDSIILKVSYCTMIEKKTLSEIEKWLNYRMDRDFKFFASYAALQLTIKGSHIPGLIDIITEMFDIDKEYRLKHMLGRLFSSRSIDLTSLRQILVSLHRAVHISSEIHAWIDRKEVLELILHLELEQITSNRSETSDFSTKPFLLMVDGCSHALQLYLLEHLRTFIENQNDVQNTSKEQYIAVITRWIIESSICENNKENLAQELYEYILKLLHDERFPLIQKAILSGVNSFCIHCRTDNNLIFLQDDAIAYLEKIICSMDIYSEDTVAICLLAYGNCLLKLHEVHTSRKVSNEVQDILTSLFDRSLIEVISIRAAFCLILSQQSSLTCNTISDWFTNKWILTSKKKYEILLQQSLYECKSSSYSTSEAQIADHIKIHDTELLDTFVLELYNHLHNKYNTDYLSDPMPNYIEIFRNFAEKNFGVFHRAIQKSSFGEKEFKKELYHYLYYGRCTNEYETIIQLYGKFSVLTIELIQMLKQFNDMQYQLTSALFDNIKQVSDRDVITKLFELLYLTASDTKTQNFSWLLRLLDSLAKNHIVSFLEVHQQLLPIIRSVLYDNKLRTWPSEHDTFYLLLKLSCIKLDSSSYRSKPILTQSCVDKEFENQIEDDGKKLCLFLRRNYFFTIFQSSFSDRN